MAFITKIILTVLTILTLGIFQPLISHADNSQVAKKKVTSLIECSASIKHLGNSKVEITNPPSIAFLSENQKDILFLTDLASASFPRKDLEKKPILAISTQKHIKHFQIIKTPIQQAAFSISTTDSTQEITTDITAKLNPQTSKKAPPPILESTSIHPLVAKQELLKHTRLMLNTLNSKLTKTNNIQDFKNECLVLYRVIEKCKNYRDDLQDLEKLVKLYTNETLIDYSTPGVQTYHYCSGKKEKYKIQSSDSNPSKNLVTPAK